MKRGYFIFFLLLLTFYTEPVRAQTKVVAFEGSITSKTGEPLNFASVSVTAKGSVIPLVHQNIGEQKSFFIQVQRKEADSLFVHVSHTGYQTVTKAVYAIPGNKYRLDFNLSVNYKELEPVIINPPPIWKKGDTTFFHVPAFKEGDERKLVDLLSKLPGFRINENGEIFYKGKQIGKLKIGGEELFADKPELLARSFPVHVLKTIQVLENQARNPLLKGLQPGEEVFLNLGLDKNKALKLFGDIEAGAGTLNRYKINPVAFSVAGKVKAGLISSNNNAGNQINSWERYKAFGTTFSEGISPLISITASPYIPDFGASRYIQNNTFDNRVQFNIPVSKSLKTNTELAFVSDRAKQLSEEAVSLYSDNAFKKRYASNRGDSRYRSFQLTETIEWSINKKSLLKIGTFFIADNSRKKLDFTFIQDDTGYIALQSIQNKWRAWQVNGNYTFRHSASKAFDLFLQYSRLSLPQTITGYSPSLYQDFSLPDNTYNSLNQPVNNFFEAVNLRLSYYTKIAKKKVTYTLFYNRKRLSRNSNLQISKQGQNSNPFLLNEYSGAGIYSINELYTQLSSRFNIFKLDWSISTEAGVTELSVAEPLQAKRKNQPLLLVSLRQEKDYSKILKGEFELEYKQAASTIYSLSTAIFPTAFASFQSYRNALLPSKTASVSYLLNFSFKNYSTLSFHIEYQKKYTSYIYQPSYNILANISIDSSVKRPTNDLFSFSSYRFPFIPLGLKVSIGNSTGRYESLSYAADQSLTKLAFLSITNRIEIVRNWNKKTFLTLKYENRLSRNLGLKAVSNSYIGKSVNSTAHFIFKQKIAKTAFGLFTLEWAKNSSSGSADASGLFADIEFKKEFTKKGIGVAVKLENIANQDTYRIYNSYSPLYQSLLTVPLVKRNVMVSASWSF